MSDRLRASDIALLAGETATTPMHNATLEVFEPGEQGFDHAALVELIDKRLAFVPRYRQVLRQVPGNLANPVWVDDPRFDLSYHVRRSGLPRPGTLEQLRVLAARIVARPLDPDRPLWEVYLIEGLEDGRVALLSKSHQVLVDGVGTVDLGQVLLDTTPRPKDLGHDEWRPQRNPTPVGLAVEAVAETLQSPNALLATGQGALVRLGHRADVARQRWGAVANALANRRPSPESPISREVSGQRRIVTVRTELETYRRLRQLHQVSVNDVVLATVTGAMRAWLLARGTSLSAMRSLRAMVPMSVIDDDLEATSLGSQVTPHLVALPIGEASPLVRLHQVSYAFKAHAETGRAVAANRLAGVAGFAPTTFHALGSRVAAAAPRRSFHLTITNVPGPQFPLYAAGARMVETYPVPPLLPGQAMAIGVTSYDGGVHYGVTGDRDALPDLAVFGQCITEALEELVDSVDTRQRAPRGRKQETQRAKKSSR